jgi:hypothetical protein
MVMGRTRMMALVVLMFGERCTKKSDGLRIFREAGNGEVVVIEWTTLSLGERRGRRDVSRLVE